MPSTVLITGDTVVMKTNRNHFPHKVVLETVLRVNNNNLREGGVIQFAISKDYAHPHSLNEDLLLAVWP